MRCQSVREDKAPAPGKRGPFPQGAAGPAVTHTTTVWGTQEPFFTLINHPQAVLLPTLFSWILSLPSSGVQPARG